MLVLVINYFNIMCSRDSTASTSYYYIFIIYLLLSVSNFVMFVYILVCVRFILDCVSQT